MIRPVAKIHGGKYYLYKWIIGYFPSNYKELKYVETCGGAASVLLNKEKSKYEIYNDLDKSISNIFYCLKNKPNQFMEVIKNIPYNLNVFENAFLSKANQIIPYDCDEDIKIAICELCLRRMSRGGLKKNFSWSERKRGGKPGDVNAWETFKNLHLPIICDRLENVQISNKHVIDIISEHDNEDVLFYIDPPYLPSTRKVKSVYDFEMNENDHILLAEVLQNTSSRIIISGYYSNLYSNLYKSWNMKTKEIANHSSQSKKKEKRLECIWINY